MLHAWKCRSQSQRFFQTAVTALQWHSSALLCVFSAFSSGTLALNLKFSILTVVIAVHTMDLDKLIHLVEEHPSLYDPKRTDYMDRDLRDNTWRSIGEEMEKSGKL